MEQISTFADQKIEDYLDHIFAPLVDVVPFAERSELRAEMREHLVNGVVARVELGLDAAQAIRETLDQFGAAETVACRWVEEWEQAVPTQASRCRAIPGSGLCVAVGRCAWRAARRNAREMRAHLLALVDAHEELGSAR